jgi:DUF4097 and DUF4098 domain-containing protein YvlB
MSINDERMLILKMLEEGKIKSDEAARLIEALENNAKQDEAENTSTSQNQSNFQEEIFKMRGKVNDWRKDFKNNLNQKDFDRMMDEFGSKAEKLGKNVAATTVGIVDKVVDFFGSFVDTNVFNIFGRYELIEKTFEASPVEGMDLELEGVNGYITVKKHLENKILIKTKVRSPQNDADAILKYSDIGNKVILKLNNIGNISVSHEVFLPAVKFDKVKFMTGNGRIYVEDTLAADFECETKNSHIELMGITGEKIHAKTKNARILLSYIICKDIDIKTNNSLIDLKHMKAENISAETMNGKIFVENAQNFQDSAQLNLNIKTANGGIKINMNDMQDRGYKIKAQTTNGGINLLIPEITYHNVNKRGMGGSFIEAESTGYENFSEKVFINAETRNGYIEVVK